MTSYLLLRNNKESGPFSLEQLVNMGLKAYDLVWVTGRSAAWRYPGEIDELKQYAPAVEEQPFDRFYKKTQPAKGEQTAASVKEQVETPALVVAPAAQSTASRKSVFVTLPGQQQRPQPAAVEKQSYPEYKQYQPQITNVAEPDPVVNTKTITITENPVAAEIKYSQPLDEIKEMYVKTLQDRKQKLAYRSFLFQALKKVAVILAIVGVGVVIGFAIRSGSSKQVADGAPASAQPQVPQDIVPVTPEEKVDQMVKEVTGATENNGNTISDRNEPSTRPGSNSSALLKNESIIQREPLSKSPAAELEKNDINSKQKEPIIDKVYPGSNVDPSSGERTKSTRAGNDGVNNSRNDDAPVPEPKATMQAGLSKLVSVRSNEYKKVAFGGIRDLELTVYNSSKYLLDRVNVELQYLKPSELPLKTENIQFKSIAPGGSLTIRVPDTNRGIKVNYKITHILSTQSAKDMADL